MSSPVAVGQQTGKISPLKGNYCRWVTLSPFVLSVDSHDKCFLLRKNEERYDLIISFISSNYI